MADAQVKVNVQTGELLGEKIEGLIRSIEDLKGFFRDESAWQALDPHTVVYRTQAFSPVTAGEEGGLFWGTTFLEPGLVGDEYFMTKGHHHTKRSAPNST